MLQAVGGYYNGDRIVMDEELPLSVGERVIITVIGKGSKGTMKDISRFKGCIKKLPVDATEYIRSMRDDDRE
ncbi:MAG: hypothetical protein IJ149_09590 [Oscillospiraceae bacterium]|nr:hypothetical protein [Oscillospiraceae bacterium]